DLGVLRAIAQRSFDASVPDGRLRALWDRRPPWRLPAVAAEEAHAVSLHDAWAASVADKSRFRGAARGASDALGLLLGGLCLALAAAALGGAFAERIRAAAATPAAARRPALAAAAVFACGKADQDPSLHGESSGLGALIRAAMGEVSAADRLSSAALAGSALVVLWYLGHRFVLEVRASLGTRGSA